MNVPGRRKTKTRLDRYGEMLQPKFEALGKDSYNYSVHPPRLIVITIVSIRPD